MHKDKDGTVTENADNHWAVTVGYDTLSGGAYDGSGNNVVTGIVSCSELSVKSAADGSSYDGGTAEFGDANTFAKMRATNRGTKCWCKMEGPMTSFWVYINDKVDVVNVDAKTMEKMFYAVAVLNEDNTISSIKVLVPEVVDYDSAMIAINIYNKAYELYKKLGTKTDGLKVDHSDALKNEFSDVYIPRRTSQVLKKKM